MQITPSIPDVGLGTAPRREPASIQTNPVPPVADALQSPDARAAAMAPVPVRHLLDAERDRESTGVRRSLISNELAAELVKQSERSAQNPSPSSGLPPNLLPVLSAWLKERVPKNGDVTRWPVSIEEMLNEIPADRRAVVFARMVDLYRGLAGSPLFSAQYLSREFGQITAVARQSPESRSESNPSELIARLRAIAAGEGAETSIAQRLADIAPDSDSAQQAARLAVEGQLLWQGEIAAGLPVRIERRDAWRSHPEREGQFQRGAQLDIEIVLPHLGPVRIVGMQWGADVTIDVRSERADVEQWDGWRDLQSMLQRQFPSIVVTTAPQAERVD